MARSDWLVRVCYDGNELYTDIELLSGIGIVAKNTPKYCIGYAFVVNLRLLTNKLGGRLDYGQPVCHSSEMKSTRARCAAQPSAKRLQRKQADAPWASCPRR